MYSDRKTLYRQIEQSRNSKVIAFITGDRPGLETQIHSEVYDYFVSHLDLIGVVPKITLYLYTRGGSTLAAWSIVNLIRQYCDDFEIVVPSKAHSAGTLMCLGAGTIVMTKQATLGPIDPSVNTPLNPQIPGAPNDARFPVSVEAINGLFDLARDYLQITRPTELNSLLEKLMGHIHPLVLGEVYRSRSQIQMLARKLISGQINDQEKINRIVSFLCSESGSHDYTIHRREARDSLGLNIEKPDDNLYILIKSIYDDVAKELELHSKLDPESVIGAQQQQASYSFKRCFLESVAGGSHYFITEGIYARLQITNQLGIAQTAIQDRRSFDGWRHHNA